MVVPQIGQRVSVTEDARDIRSTSHPDDIGVITASLGDGWWRVRTDGGLDQEWHEDIIVTSEA